MSAWDSICGDCGRVKPCECDALPRIAESTRTIVVNKKNYRGEGIEIGRHTPFGNPYRPDAYDGRDACIARFESYFLGRVKYEPDFRRLVLTLRGKVLICSCKPLSCHGDVIAKWLDAQP